MGAAMLVDITGRRTLFLISNGGMLVTFICWTVATALYDTANNVAAAKGAFKSFPSRRRFIPQFLLAVIPLIFIFYFFYDVAYTPLLVAYTLEILPLRVRARGFAVTVCAVFASYR